MPVRFWAADRHVDAAVLGRVVGPFGGPISRSLRFADRLAAAQVDVEMIVYAGMPHAFMQLSLVDECGLAIEAAGRFLRERLGSAGASGASGA